jgi:hypothetical protein
VDRLPRRKLESKKDLLDELESDITDVSYQEIERHCPRRVDASS